MPINIPDDLPAYKVLTDENIFVMNQTRATTQRIRPLKNFNCEYHAFKDYNRNTIIKIII